MTLYVDSSALLKRHVDEADSAAADAFLRSDPTLITARHTVIEVRRNLARLLGERSLVAARRAFAIDLDSIGVIELDSVTCEAAATISEVTGVRTLDALHLAAAQRVGATETSFLTYDLRQAQAARTLGFLVLGS